MFTSEETWQLFESNDCESVSGVGLAIQPDIPLHRAESKEGLLVPVSGADGAEGRDREQVGDEVIRGN